MFVFLEKSLGLLQPDIRQITVGSLSRVFLKYPLEMIRTQINEVAYIFYAYVRCIILLHQIYGFPDIWAVFDRSVFCLLMIRIQIPNQLEHYLCRQAEDHLRESLSVIHHLLLITTDQIQQLVAVTAVDLPEFKCFAARNFVSDFLKQLFFNSYVQKLTILFRFTRDPIDLIPGADHHYIALLGPVLHIIDLHSRGISEEQKEVVIIHAEFIPDENSTGSKMAMYLQIVAFVLEYISGGIISKKYPNSDPIKHHQISLLAEIRLLLYSVDQSIMIVNADTLILL